MKSYLVLSPVYEGGPIVLGETVEECKQALLESEIFLYDYPTMYMEESRLIDWDGEEWKENSDDHKMALKIRDFLHKDYKDLYEMDLAWRDMGFGSATDYTMNVSTRG